ncbi:MAG: polyphosphate polymerase domain-containing protein [Oscillospiraceae bacterium]|jgi:hypothetical protein|nr:polyphosphate polymerase domain-containing protein [Oscillospiraceae bacterium]
MLSRVRRVFFDSSYIFPNDDGFRHEIKFTLQPGAYYKFRDFCLGFMDLDKNANENGEYTVKSHYFDTLYFADYNEKLNGIYERQKYRARTYGDTGYYKLEKKMKRGNLNKKFSGEICAEHVNELIRGQMDIKTGNENTDSIIYEMYLKACRHSAYIVYNRQAFLLKELDIRITFDKDISALYGNCIFNEHMPDPIPVFYGGETILEIKYKDYLPKWIERAIHQLVPSEYSVSKYAESLGNILK